MVYFRFPPAQQIEWLELFPSFTYSNEINLVSKLIIYNPSKRLKAYEVITIIILLLLHYLELFSIFLLIGIKT